VKRPDNQLEFIPCPGAVQTEAIWDNLHLHLIYHMACLSFLWKCCSV